MNIPNELPSEEVGFEGPEKNFQVIFGHQDSASLRSVSQSRWQLMLDHAKCKILSSIKNHYCTAYILSESSLFVYDDRVILKTCGQTPLLLSVDDILSIGSDYGLKPAAVLYWRKNFTNPQLQLSIHRSFSTEVEFLEAHFGVHGNTAQVGSLENDHWYFFYAELLDKKLFKPVFPTFEIKMHEVHTEVTKQFFWNNSKNPEIIEKIHSIIPGSLIDEFFFDPCGYSMNGLIGVDYQTIHITPEDFCSYVSFETTNEIYRETRIKEFRVLELFRPDSWTAVEISQKHSPDGLPDIPSYGVKESSFITLGDSLTISFYSYETTESHPLSQVGKKRREGIANGIRQSQ
ncbi:S-adenosylmethionine decarboxylase proenzyme [Histomonas meleagridis]|uniref:S-adenosylmethionine decarboxylase proenzyme n=1 Tax=Histomonas meleagridis TaxID=135588 RepID=UPI00355A4DA1|nr:S-adenosylmethionine decarboxylase proenzyme [Histomonas meleagridis]KAH0796773.1 S-adenosylmethionine decarboxylase proenzyme [Histomonas meleagridis]